MKTHAHDPTFGDCVQNKLKKKDMNCWQMKNLFLNMECSRSVSCPGLAILTSALSISESCSLYTVKEKKCKVNSESQSSNDPITEPIPAVGHITHYLITCYSCLIASFL